MMDAIQIVSLTGAIIVLTVGIFAGTTLIVTHHKHRIGSNFMNYGSAVAEYIVGIAGFIIFILLAITKG